MKLENFISKVIEQYQLHKKALPRVLCTFPEKGIYNPHKVDVLVQNLLEESLGKNGYKQSQFTSGLWTHEWFSICFSLVVDNFGVKYVQKEHADHLVSVIHEHYEITMDWEGKQ